MPAATRYLRTLRRAASALTVGGRGAKRDLSNFLAGSPDGGRGGDAPGLPGAPPPRAIDLGDFWPADRAVCLTELAASSHNVSERELVALCCLAAAVDARELFEFGTFDGRTGANLLRNCPGSRLTTLNVRPEDMNRETLDSAGGEVGGRLRRAADLEGRWQQVFAWSHEHDYAPLAGSMDFVFVDAGHGYDAVRHDSAAAARMLRPGGVIAWHDYGHLRGHEPFPGLTRAVDEFFASGTAPGEAVFVRGTRVAARVPASLLGTSGIK